LAAVEINDRAGVRLTEHMILWLTTVGPEGRPQSSPVWFLWDGAEQLLVYSLDDTARVRNIAGNPRVAANLNSNATGGDVVTMEGFARIDRDFPQAKDMAAYVAKYQPLLDDFGWTPEHFSTDYCVPILIAIDRIRTIS
jgi:PPOX class probable F420-dependent enzyme